MKVIRNHIIPFDGFLCVNLFGVLFVREELSRYMTDEVYNHERIHTEQMRELGYVGFYLIYILEWLFRFLFTKDAFSYKAYLHISFEVEANANESNFGYRRRHYAQWRG